MRILILGGNGMIGHKIFQVISNKHLDTWVLFKKSFTSIEACINGLPINKLSINFGATLDPYQIDGNGNRINKINSNIFRLTSANVSANVSLSSRDFEKKETKKTKRKFDYRTYTHEGYCR